MHAVLYRWRVKPGATEQFRNAWRRGTTGIQERFKSGGSRLHRAADGTWIAYAVWPSAKAREVAFELGVLQLHPAVGEMLTYVEEVLDEILLAVTGDLIVPDDSPSNIGD